jgi:hypothetical protein
VRATFLMADMLNPYTSSHQLILSSCWNKHFKVLCRVYVRRAGLLHGMTGFDSSLVPTLRSEGDY